MIAEQLAVHGPAIIAKAMEQAEDGDSNARNFIYERVYGKAPQTVTTTVTHEYKGQVNIAVLAQAMAAQLKESKTE